MIRSRWISQQLTRVGCGELAYRARSVVSNVGVFFFP